MVKLVVNNETTPNEIRKAGIKALSDALGPVGMAMFLQQFDRGQGDYTKDREEVFRDLKREDVLQGIRKIESRK